MSLSKIGNNKREIAILRESLADFALSLESFNKMVTDTITPDIAALQRRVDQLEAWQEVSNETVPFTVSISGDSVDKDMLIALINSMTLEQPSQPDS